MEFLGAGPGRNARMARVRTEEPRHPRVATPPGAGPPGRMPGGQRAPASLLTPVCGLCEFHAPGGPGAPSGPPGGPGFPRAAPGAPPTVAPGRPTRAWKREDGVAPRCGRAPSSRFYPGRPPETPKTRKKLRTGANGLPRGAPSSRFYPGRLPETPKARGKVRTQSRKAQKPEEKPKGRVRV